MRVSSCATALLFVFLASMLAGCGGSGEFNVAPVTGKVTCNGQPVTNGNITFSPIGTGGAGGAGKAASAEIDAQGNYTLSTYDSEDGAVIGRHVVSISSNDAYKPLACKVPPNLEYEVKDEDNVINIELSGTGAAGS